MWTQLQYQNRSQSRKFFLAMAARMTGQELQKYIEKMNMASDKAHENLMDIALYSEGAVSYGDLLQMPMKRVKMFSERIDLKRNGGKTNEQLTPGEVNGPAAMPEIRQEIR